MSTAPAVPPFLIIGWDLSAHTLTLAAACSTCRVQFEADLDIAELRPAHTAWSEVAGRAEELVRESGCMHSFDHVRDGVLVGTRTRLHGDSALLIRALALASGAPPPAPPVVEQQVVAFRCTCHIDKARCNLHKKPAPGLI